MDKQNVAFAVCVPIRNRSRYVDLEIEARIDEPIEDLALFKYFPFSLHFCLFSLLYNQSW